MVSNIPRRLRVWGLGLKDVKSTMPSTLDLKGLGFGALGP